MGKPDHIELGDGTCIPILYEDRSVVAIDKPPGWMLVPHTWQKTHLNLQAAIVSSIASGAFWARSRGLRFLRHVHRLDAETSGILLFARSMGAMHTFGDLFETRQMEKRYLVVVEGTPAAGEWTCHLKLGPDPREIGRMQVDEREGKAAETHFKLVRSIAGTSLLEARPVTGRTHQIRLHLSAGGWPVVGDPLYGKPRARPASGRSRVTDPTEMTLGLRAVSLSYRDPFNRRAVQIHAPEGPFLRKFGYG